MEQSKTQNYIKLAIAVLLILGIIWYLESTKADSGSAPVGNQDIEVGGNLEGETEAVLLDTEARLAGKALEYEPAKEISTPDGFINVDDIDVGGLIGKKIILIDFWTYSCINCQRTLPFLNDWHEKYADDGLVILGIHTPEFEFEKDFDNVSRAVDKWAVEYPVILDNDYSTWRSYQILCLTTLA